MIMFKMTLKEDMSISTGISPRECLPIVCIQFHCNLGAHPCISMFFFIFIIYLSKASIPRISKGTLLIRLSDPFIEGVTVA